LLKDDRKQLFELKDFVDHRVNTPGTQQNKAECELYREIITNIKRCLVENTLLVPITQFSRELQHEVLRWVFKNEDRVWRRRGGRPGHETAEAFVGFSHQSARPECAERRPLPGIIGFVCGKQEDREVSLQGAIREGNVVSYSVGEYVSHEQYEIVTAWVDKRFKGLSLAVSMYLQTFDMLNDCNCPRVLVDVVKGTVDKLIRSSPAIEFVAKAGLRDRVIISQVSSYQIASDSGAEHFERIELAVSYLSLASSWHNRVTKLHNTVDTASRFFSKFKKSLF
jgi:hypothetical protein